MFKYVLKRLGLSCIVLLGVSIIIYFLVRLMPVDYLETKFSSQIQQGTITLEQINEIKKTYGLYMPDAYLEFEIDGYEEPFVKDITQKKFEDLGFIEEDKSDEYIEFFAGEYETKKDIFLVLTKEKVYSIVDRSDDEKKVLETGIFSADLEGISLYASGVEKDYNYNYRVAGAGEKLKAVFGGYFTWLGNMLKGDLGHSFSKDLPVGQVIAEKMWISFAISFVALIFQFTIAISLGIISATRQYSAVDYTVTVITMIGISLPSFFFAALLIKVFAIWLGWFPTIGSVDANSSSQGFALVLETAHHLVLPMVVLIVLSIGGLMRYTRTNMLEVLNSDYIRTARSKGLSEKKVIYVHAFRNTMIPLMTILAGILPSLFGGAMIVEEVFAIEGIGRTAYQALRSGDVPFVMGYNMFLAILTVIGTLLSDLMYAVVDPRVKLAK